MLKYPPPVMSTTVTFITTAVAEIGMLSIPVTVTFSVFPPPSVVSVLFAAGGLSYGQELGCGDWLHLVSASLAEFTGV